MPDNSDKPNLETTCAHLGGTAAAHVSPLVLASVMDFPSIEASLGPMEGAGYVYRRNGNPNGDEMAAAVAKLEGAERGLATSSGMAAISAALFGLLESGDVLVVPDDCYGGVRSLVKSELSRFGIETRVVDMRDEAALDEALVGARVAFFETISNPLLRTPDVGRALEMARSRGRASRLLTTPLQRRCAIVPLRWGPTWSFTRRRSF